jgi:hypothetical protein
VEAVAFGIEALRECAHNARHTRTFMLCRPKNMQDIVEHSLFRSRVRPLDHGRGSLLDISGHEQNFKVPGGTLAGTIFGGIEPGGIR